MKFNEWCKPCNSRHLQENFEKWLIENNENSENSKNSKIYEFLKEVQSKAKSPDKVMEWISYKDLFVKEPKIAKGGFGTVYLANWLNGPIAYWDTKYKKWKRYQCRPVALKFLNNSNNITNLLEEVSKYIIIWFAYYVIIDYTKICMI